MLGRVLERDHFQSVMIECVHTSHNRMFVKGYITRTSVHTTEVDNCERSELSGLFNGTDYIYIYFFSGCPYVVP